MKEFKNFDEAKKNAEYTGTEQIILLKMVK